MFCLKRSRLLMAAAVAILPACSAHEGPEFARVKGVVTLDDAPLAGAFVRFSPKDSRQQTSRGVTNESGEYELVCRRDIRGAVVGLHDVFITTATEHNPMERLPARYSLRSELQADVKSGRENVIDFELDTDAR